MTRKISSVAILSLLLLAFLGMSAFAAQSPNKRVTDLKVYKSLQYAFPYPNDELHHQAASSRTVPTQQLGSRDAGISPGTAIGDTWYDYQHNGSMGRQVETNFGTVALVHFTWMYLAGPVFQSRKYYYYSYDITDGVQNTKTGIQPDDNYGGYVGITTTNDNRAVVGGHNEAGQAVDANLNAPQFYWDYGEGSAYFGATSRVPRQLQEYQEQVDSQVVIWPAFRYVEGPTDTVLHILAQASLPNAGDAQSLYYFRRVGGDDNPSPVWTYPPYIVDTIYDISQDIAATNDGKVALVWTANLPCSMSDPDTASGTGCRDIAQEDNDIYYQISTDYGVTFQPRVNVTNYRYTEGTDSYRPYTDISALYDSGGELHIVWAARAWPAGSQIAANGTWGLYRGRIFHWSTDEPYIRTAVSADWDQTTCSPGAWNLNAGKMSISECNGKFYILYVQINNIPAGIEDDCAVESNPGYPTGAGNGDLYVVVSDDHGLDWDAPRDITNSYTPGCDSVGGVGGPCDNDNWPSMARYGTSYALNPGDNATAVIVPTGGTDDGNYLDIEYIDDHSAGGIVQDEGTWQDADVRWIRLACVAPVPNPNPVFTPTAVSFPAWIKPGHVIDTTLKIENIGNSAYNFTVTSAESLGAAGWLSISGFPTSVNYGVNNEGTGTIQIDASSYSPGDLAQLVGFVIFSGNNPNSPDTVKLHVIVADSIVPPVVDTVATNCLSLAILNNGSFGDQGRGKVNMDYYNAGDCDTNATIYIYDGSPVVGWIDGTDTIMNWSAYGASYVTPNGFFQQTEGTKTTVGMNQEYSSMFSTRDTSLMMEKTYYAPQQPDSCHFIIERLKVWSGDGASHSGLTIGEAIDWDIPADSGARNGSGINESAGLIYLYGAEYNQDTATECTLNSSRYGGTKFLGMFNHPNDATWDDLGTPYGTYTADNATYVYNNTYGFKAGQLYAKMQDPGYSTFSSSDPDSLYADLHEVLTYQTGYTINPGDTLVAYVALVTVPGDPLAKSLATFTSSANAAYAWYCAHVLPNPPGCGCCKLRGDVDHSGALNVSDLTNLVGIIFKNFPPPPCPDEADVDASGALNVSDLTNLVGIIFKNFPPAPPC